MTLSAAGRASRFVVVSVVLALSGPSTPAEAKWRPLVRSRDCHSVAHYTDAQLRTFCRTEPRSSVPINKTMTMTFHLDAPPDEVWHALTTARPSEVWRTSATSFRKAFAPGRSAPMEPSRWTGLQSGQTLFVDLHGIPRTNLFNMALGLQVTEVDASARRIKFRYVNPSPSMGTQMISVFPTLNADGKLTTTIVHGCEYAGQSILADRLYRTYHKMALTGFYDAVARITAASPPPGPR